MKKQAWNPYLPSWEYVPDGEPHVFGDRLYVYGSHDRFGGDTYCLEPYVCWSAPVEDLSDWTCHGVIYTGEGDTLNETGKRLMFAPDVAEYRGKYYLYYGLDSSIAISVAVSDRPEGPYSFYGNVHHRDGQILGLKKGDAQQFDPGIFVDDDGRVYLYSGFSTTPEVAERIRKKMGDKADALHVSTEGNWVIELEEDMLTVKSEPKRLLPGVSNSAGTGFEGHEFFEASSMRRFGGTYYAVYSSVQGHELCYAMSDRPDGGFVYKGVLHSNGNLGISDKPLYYYANNHGSLVEAGGAYYIFGHRHTSYTQYQRQGVAEQVFMEADGSFAQAEMTSCGLNGKPLAGSIPAILPASCSRKTVPARRTYPSTGRFIPPSRRMKGKRRLSQTSGTARSRALNISTCASSHPSALPCARRSPELCSYKAKRTEGKSPRFRLSRETAGRNTRHRQRRQTGKQRCTLFITEKEQSSFRNLHFVKL